MTTPDHLLCFDPIVLYMLQEHVSAFGDVLYTPGYLLRADTGLISR
jgi:hypothetical protein